MTPPGRYPEPLPVGMVEIAERLGVRQQTVAMWKYRGLLPEPRWTVSKLPAWDWADIWQWAQDTGRVARPVSSIDKLLGRDTQFP